MTQVVPVMLCEPDGNRTPGSMTISDSFNVTGPLISCVMVSRGHRYPAAFAIECYQQQTYANRELIIVTANRDDELAALLAELGDPSIKLVKAAEATLGELRNITIAHAAGEWICQWDDDDLSATNRIDVQLAAIAQSHSTACYLGAITLWWPARRWLAVSEERAWENTMLVKREAIPIYAAENRGEDTRVARMIGLHHRVCLIGYPQGYYYVQHGRNISAEEHFQQRFDLAKPLVLPAEYSQWLTARANELPIASYAAFID